MIHVFSTKFYRAKQVFFILFYRHILYFYFYKYIKQVILCSQTLHIFVSVSNYLKEKYEFVA